MVVAEPTMFAPPDLSKIISDRDQLQPTAQQLEDATQRSRDYWYRLAAAAVTRHRAGFSPALMNPRNMLSRVPAISTRQGQTTAFELETSGSKMLCIEASSTWRVSETSECDVMGKTKEVIGLLQIGNSTTIPCQFEGKSFRQWPGISGEGNRKPNYLGVLALGWAYVLSARLLELHREGCEMKYTDLQPGNIGQGKNRSCSSSLTIDIGKVDEDAARWWSAVMAPGQGWKAILSRSTDEEFLAPWSVSICDQNRFEIVWERKESVSRDPATSTPPSSKKAFEYLVQFCQRHNLGSQLSVALATALTFFTHNYQGTTIQLPFPVGNPAQQGTHSTNHSALDWDTINHELPYYMTLSCSLELVISALCGMFWEQNVTCNMVSPWLHPVLNEIPESPDFSSAPGLYHELIAVMCSFRQPQIFSQSVTSGLAPHILDIVRDGSPPLEQIAFPWTGCPQSFMDIPGTGPYIRDQSSGEVERADVWRLLYLPPVVDDDLHYNSRPFTPWAPFGSTTVRNCVLRVAAHLKCPRHNFEYAQWNWHLEDGSTVKAQEFDSQSSSKALEEDKMAIKISHASFLQSSPTQDASENASLNIFLWVTVNGEGTPPEKIYKDRWVQFEDDLESHEDEGMLVGEKEGSHA